MTRDEIRNIYNAAIGRKVVASDTIALINHLTCVEWDNGCLAAENEALREAIRAKGFRIDGSSFAPLLHQIAEAAPVHADA